MSASSQDDVDRALAAFDAWPILYHNFRNGPAYRLSAAALPSEPEPSHPAAETREHGARPPEEKPEPVHEPLVETAPPPLPEKAPPESVAEAPSAAGDMFRRLADTAGRDDAGVPGDEVPGEDRHFHPAAPRAARAPPSPSLPGLRDLFRNP